MALLVAASMEFSRGGAVAVTAFLVLFVGPTLAVIAYLIGEKFAKRTHKPDKISVYRVRALHLLTALYCGFVIWKDPFSGALGMLNRSGSGHVVIFNLVASWVLQIAVPWVVAQLILTRLENYQPNVILPSDDPPLAEPVHEPAHDGEEWSHS